MKNKKDIDLLFSSISYQGNYEKIRPDFTTHNKKNNFNLLKLCSLILSFIAITISSFALIINVTKSNIIYNNEFENKPAILYSKYEKVNIDNNLQEVINKVDESTRIKVLVVITNFYTIYDLYNYDYNGISYKEICDEYNYYSQKYLNEQISKKELMIYKNKRNDAFNSFVKKYFEIEKKFFTLIGASDISTLNYNHCSMVINKTMIEKIDDGKCNYNIYLSPKETSNVFNYDIKDFYGNYITTTLIYRAPFSSFAGDYETTITIDENANIEKVEIERTIDNYFGLNEICFNEEILQIFTSNPTEYIVNGTHIYISNTGIYIDFLLDYYGIYKLEKTN